MEPRTMSPTALRLLDVVVVIVIATVGVWRELAQDVPARWLLPAPVGVYIAVEVVAALALLWRRRLPSAVAGVVAALSLIAPAQAAVVAAYSVTAHEARRARSGVMAAALIACWCLGAMVWTLADPVSGPLVLVLATVLGLYVHARRRLIGALVERAERAERERVLLAEAAVADERTRLAAEMHDVLAHRISLLVLQAGALEVSTTDPDVRRRTDELRRSGVAALAELREVVWMLRDQRPEPFVEGPAVDDGPDLEALVAEWESVGVVVEMVVEGTPPDLDPTIGRAMFRVAEEGITNASKHAPGAAVRIEVRYEEDGVDLLIANGAAERSPDSALRSAGAGFGLSGLRHRVEMLGGRLTVDDGAASGGGAGGGFEVRAQLPRVVPVSS